MNRRFWSLVLILLLNCLNAYSEKFTKLDENSSFSVSLNNVPDTAISSIKFALSLFDELFSTNIDINISIEYSTTKRYEFAAGASPTGVFKNFSDLVPQEVYYPVALAEKLSNKEINPPSQADITCIINQNKNWVYQIDRNDKLDTLFCVGQDGSEPKLDFITLFVHEICHGLGINSQLILIDGLFDENSLVTIYDNFLYYNKTSRIVEHLDNVDSISHYLTSENLWLKSSFFEEEHKDSLLKIYSPSDFTIGNSTHHLDELVYDSSTVDRLMSPVYHCEYQRELGLATESILKEIGWSKPNISHYKPYDQPITSLPTQIELETYDSKIDSILLSYSFDDFSNSIILNADNNNGKSVFSVPSIAFNHNLSYKFHIYKESREYIYPSKDEYIQIYRGNDTIKPQIHLSDFNIVYITDSALTIGGRINDNSGISYSQITVSSMGVIDTLLNDTIMNQEFSYIYNVPKELSVGDTLMVQISSADLSNRANNANKTELIIIQNTPDIKRNYSTTFEDDNDFYLDGFQVTKNQYLNSSSLQTIHPYLYPNVEQDTIYTYAQLKTRIIIDSINHYLKFEEIVLVEPSDEGKSFDEFGFWDYVTIEGSKDNIHWYAFEEVGYDSGSDINWYDRYYENTVTVGENINSLSIPNDDLYKSHTINLIQNKYLRKGDTISIRFQLVSDAFSNGWGWSIDNLEIQTQNVKSAFLQISKSYIYPNPVNDLIHISTGDISKSQTFQIYSLTGQLVLSGVTNMNSIDISSLPEGSYFIVLSSSGKVFSFIKT